MSHLTSPPPKHKGEHKGHGLPRGSERWVGGWEQGILGGMQEGRMGLGVSLDLTPSTEYPTACQGKLLPGQGPERDSQ